MRTIRTCSRVCMCTVQDDTTTVGIPLEELTSPVLYYFCCYPKAFFSWSRPICWFRLVSHVLGHKVRRSRYTQTQACLTLIVRAGGLLL